MNRVWPRYALIPALLAGFPSIPPLWASVSSDTTARAQQTVTNHGDTEIAKIRELMNLGKYSDAESRARALLEPGPPTTIDSLQRAGLLDLRAEALMREGKSNQPAAIESAEQGVALRQRIQGPSHPDLARSLSVLGNIRRARGEFAEARECHQRALTIREGSLGPNHADVGVSLHNLALIHQDMAEYPEARVLYERAIEIHRTALGPDHPREGASSNNLANVLRSMGEVAEARRLSGRALAIREKQLGPDHPLVAESLHNLALQLQEMGDLEEARPLYDRAIVIEEATLGSDHPQLASSLNNRGNLLGSLGEFSGARSDLERALAIRDRVLGANHPDVAECATSLGYLLERTGDFVAVRALYDRALAIAETAFGPDHALLPPYLDNVGTVQWRTGSADSAETLFERSAAIRRKALGLDHPDVGKSLISLAFALAALGQSAAAFDTALEGNRIINQHLHLASRSLPERQALNYCARDAGLDLILTLASEFGSSDPSANDRAWEAVIRSRAAVLDEMAARHRVVVEAGDTALVSLAATWASSRQRVANLMVRGIGGENPERYRATLRSASAECEVAEERMAASSASFREARAVEHAGLSEVRAALPKGSVLVAYARYLHQQPRLPNAEAEPRYLAFVLRGGTGHGILVRLGDAATIDSLVSEWRSQAGKPPSPDPRAHAESRYRSVAGSLKRKVWDPIAPFVAAKLALLVPDGALNLVGFAALPTSDTRYLLEQDPVLHYLGAERDVIRGPSILNQNGLLVVGDPDYDVVETTVPATAVAETSRDDPAGGASYRGSRSGCRAFTESHWPRLPGTAREVQEVAGLWRKSGGSGRELVGAQASEPAFKSGAPHQRVLHLATHGFFLGSECPSAFDRTPRGIGGLVSGGDSTEPKPSAQMGENPLQLSGLVLAGANQHGRTEDHNEDGILTAEEIATLDLSGTEWAVLSACETGVGVVRAGEGVFGLRRAFRVAGAKTVIMSLWSVEDEATRAWMKSLYEARIEQHKGTAAAIQQASRSLLKEHRRQGESTHPFYWAAFVGAGRWE